MFSLIASVNGLEFISEINHNTMTTLATYHIVDCCLSTIIVIDIIYLVH